MQTRTVVRTTRPMPDRSLYYQRRASSQAAKILSERPNIIPFSPTLRPPLSPLRSQRRMADDMNYLTRLVAAARLHTQVRRRGHGEPESRAFSRLASHANVASVRLDDAAGDEQAQARATRGTARYTVELLE